MANLGSEESTQLLKDYQERNEVIGLALRFLLAKEEDVAKIYEEVNMPPIQRVQVAAMIKEIRLDIEKI